MDKSELIPKVSIVTATYSTGRLKDIKQLLDSANRQTSTDFDMSIIVEREPKIAEDLINYISKNQYSNMAVIYNDGPGGASANRNLAIQKARGNIIAFVDDDAVLNPGWVEAIVQAFDEDTSVIGVTGPILPLWQIDSGGWVPPEFYWIFSCTNDDEQNKVEVRNGYCTNLSFKKEAFHIAGVFNVDLGVKGRDRRGWQEPGGEETELAIRIQNTTGKRIIYNPKVIVQHKVYSYRLTGGFITRRAFWEGYAKALIKDRFRSMEKGSDVLATEHALLKRILFFRLPRSFKLLFYQPRSATRQIGLIFTVLTCVFAGYTTSKLKILVNSGRNEGRN
jgi:glucosyl-dolichyl phosphate glucuronosyltransferase